ncbi:MAG TPA: Spy/CpxP family protein refolding chaperone [Terriglobales bacterium]|nr:Spy/CpxP family protein refolding chaperone [Terriglobales bacterium]
MKRKVTVMFFASVLAMAGQSFSQSARFGIQPHSASAESNALASVLSVPSATPRGPEDLLQDYEDGMRSIAQQFSQRLAVIAGAVNRGELTREQAEDVTAEQYQSAQMQFDLLSALREMLQLDIQRAAATPRPAPDSSVQSEIVTVALPFSSLQLNPSIIDYLDLSSAQVASIEKVMSDERRSLVPLMTRMQETREQLLSVTDQDETRNDKEIKVLAAAQARNQTELIVANSRMRTRIYQLLSPTQQKKLDEFQRQ